LQLSFALLLCGLAVMVCEPSSRALAQEAAPARNEIQTFGIDRESVNVAWTGEAVTAPLLVTCGITTRRSRGSESTACWYMAKPVVDRITENAGDRKHRLYRRTISDDGRAMTLTWLSEEGRTNVISVRTFDRANR
jgi:hypothetical protein